MQPLGEKFALLIIQLMSLMLNCTHQSPLTRDVDAFAQDDDSTVQEDDSMDDSNAILLLLEDVRRPNEFVVLPAGGDGELFSEVSTSSGGEALTVTIDATTISLENGSSDDERPTLVEMKRGPPRVKRGG